MVVTIRFRASGRSGRNDPAAPGRVGWLVGVLEQFGGMVRLAGLTLRHAFKRPFETELWLEQFY